MSCIAYERYRSKRLSIPRRTVMHLLFSVRSFSRAVSPSRRKTILSSRSRSRWTSSSSTAESVGLQPPRSLPAQADCHLQFPTLLSLGRRPSAISFTRSGINRSLQRMHPPYSSTSVSRCTATQPEPRPPSSYRVPCTRKSTFGHPVFRLFRCVAANMNSFGRRFISAV